MQVQTETWKNIETQLKDNSILTGFSTVIQQDDRDVKLDIDIDLGGGFEGGYEFTRFSSPLKSNGFELNIYEKNILADAAKLLGMQDVLIGSPEIDKQFIFKSNDQAKLKEVFSEEAALQLFNIIPSFTLKTNLNSSNESLLELFIEEGITDIEKLQKIYSSFYILLLVIDK